MKVGRNDPCPCGSGKKYKKCCMNKDNVVQFQEVKEERFFQQKHALVNQLSDFIDDKITSSHYYQLSSQFKKRTDGKLGEQQRGFFNFWLYFFNRYENGLRGIEWFLAENKHRLSGEEKVMAERWASLKPQLVQAVDHTKSDVVLKDHFTKQTYHVSKSKENIPRLFPWFSTFGLLEPVENHYYFNGVRSLSSPNGFQHAIDLVEKCLGETDLHLDQLLMDYYPEILAALVDVTDAEDLKEKEIIHYIYTFTLADKARAENFLYNDRDFEIDRWEETTKKLTWIGNLQAYTDSELDGHVQLGEVHASLEIKNETLTFSSFDLAIVNQFLKKLRGDGGSFRLIDDQEERIKVPVQAEFKQMAVSMDKGVPEYFALYAQNGVTAELDQAIPKYDYLSLRGLVENGKKELAEIWLKQSEYNLYEIVYKQYGIVEVTADFNTARRELGLDQSPFVTGGERRESTLKPFNPSKQRDIAVLEADIPVYENLGFSPETINNFYTKDIIAFYKERTYGKSEGTERKYRNSLYDIREILEKSSAESWADCDLFFWESLLAKDFFELNVNVSRSMVKDMITTVKGLTKWLAKHKKLAIAKQVNEIVTYYQPRMLHAVQLLEHENPYQARAYNSAINELGSILRQIDKDFDLNQTGEFKIMTINKRSIRTVNMDNAEELTISLDESAVQHAEEGMILSAKIGKSKPATVWNIIHLERVCAGSPL